jgi:hypothetical protein
MSASLRPAAVARDGANKPLITLFHQFRVMRVTGVPGLALGDPYP